MERFRFFDKALLRIVLLILGSCTLAQASFKVGDVFIARGGQIDVYDPYGTLLQSIDTSNFGGSFGMTFDTKGNLYTVNDTGVVEFDSNGNFIRVFDLWGVSQRSILHDAAGNFYIGLFWDESVTFPMWKVDPLGNTLGAYAAMGEITGPFWITLAPDQKTMIYTSQGCHVKSYNVATNAQNPDIVGCVLGPWANGVRILPDSSIIVVTANSVSRWANNPLCPYPQCTYQLVQSYIPSGASHLNLYPLALDPDGVSFWTVDYPTGIVYRFNAKTGQQTGTFATGITSNSYGIAIFGEGMNSTTSFTPRLIFPNQHVGTTSTPLHATIKNTGNIEIVATSFRITGDFAISKNQCASGI
jgi:hypothetical protein